MEEREDLTTSYPRSTGSVGSAERAPLLHARRAGSEPPQPYLAVAPPGPGSPRTPASAALPPAAANGGGAPPYLDPAAMLDPPAPEACAEVGADGVSSPRGRYRVLRLPVCGYEWKVWSTFRYWQIFACLCSLFLALMIIVSLVVDSVLTDRPLSVTVAILSFYRIAFCVLAAVAEADTMCPKCTTTLHEVLIVFKHWSLRGLFYFYLGVAVIDMSMNCDDMIAQNHVVKEKGGDTVAQLANIQRTFEEGSVQWTKVLSAGLVCSIGAVYFLMGICPCLRRIREEEYEKWRSDQPAGPDGGASPRVTADHGAGPVHHPRQEAMPWGTPDQRQEEGSAAGTPDAVDGRWSPRARSPHSGCMPSPARSPPRCGDEVAPPFPRAARSPPVAGAAGAGLPAPDGGAWQHPAATTHDAWE